MSRDVYLVVGGDGFLGRHIVEKLQARGDEVASFDIVQRYNDVPHYVGDISHKNQVFEVFKKSGATCIFHTASPLSTVAPREAFPKVTEEGTRNVLSACQALGIPKLIFTSSSGVVFNGMDVKGGDETLPYVSPQSHPYMVSKEVAERELLAANGKDGVFICILRPSTILGPGDRQTMPHYYSVYKEGKSGIQFGDGTNLMDYTYVTNVADAHLLAADRLHPNHSPPVAGQIFFVTNDDPWPFWDVSNFVFKQFDRYHPGFRSDKPPVVIPKIFAQIIAFLFETVCMLIGKKPVFTRFLVAFACAHRWYTIEKAKKTLGYKPEVSMEDGLTRAVEWFMEQVPLEDRAKLEK